MTKINVNINPKNVVSAYNGKVGCMCGCMGNYAYSSDVKDKGKEIRGYEISENEVSDSKIKHRLKKIETMISEGDCDEVNIGDNYVYVSKGDRCYMISTK